MDYETAKRLARLGERIQQAQQEVREQVEQEQQATPMTTTELRPAFQWTYDECGCDQFESAVVLGEDIDDQDWEGVWMIQPDEVQCNNCSAVFETLEFGDSEGEW